ncbi:MAG: c-type cytochrome [Solirubrobacterales bacterium]|nr:c-type cytochrome [Solirubrobacterales bacterium]
MVAVIIIAVVFTGLAALIAWAAPRGKLTPVTNAILSQSQAAKIATYAVCAVTFVGFGVVVPLIFLIGNHDRAKADVAGVKLTSAQVQGRQLFGQHCAVCHTLAAASAVGKTGPNLDQIKPSQSLVLNTLAHGCLAKPGAGQQAQSCLGEGTMPADVVQGQDATDVAQFVSKVAGHP